MTDLPPVPDDVIERIIELAWVPAGVAANRVDPRIRFRLKDTFRHVAADPAFQRHTVDVLKASGVLKLVLDLDGESWGESQIGKPVYTIEGES